MQHLPSTTIQTSYLIASFMRISVIDLEAKTAKILVIEDDKMSRVMLCRVLRSKKYATLEASNGVTGLQLCKAEKPDLILMDILMPEKEGLETIMEIRAVDAKVPIVAMSGSGNAHELNYLQMAGKLGASRTIAKPFRPDEILSLMASLGIPAENAATLQPQTAAG